MGKNQPAENLAGYNKDIDVLFIPAVYKDAQGKKRKIAPITVRI